MLDVTCALASVYNINDLSPQVIIIFFRRRFGLLYHCKFPIHWPLFTVAGRPLFGGGLCHRLYVSIFSFSFTLNTDIPLSFLFDTLELYRIRNRLTP